MREYKFRGKSSYKGKWVFGSLDTAGFVPAKIRWLDKDGLTPMITEVDPETVGQYTGLRDCKKREIYEGDIVKVTSYGEETFHIVKYMLDLDYAGFDLDPYLCDDCNSLSYSVCDYETKILVIGNIYDNPELAEKCKRQVCD